MTNPEPVILTGDCLERLKELPDGSVDAVITDPPSSSPLDMSAGVQRQDKEERRKRLAKAMRRAKKRRSRLPKREDQGDLSGLVSELEVAKKSIASATEMVL